MVHLPYLQYGQLRVKAHHPVIIYIAPYFYGGRLVSKLHYAFLLIRMSTNYGIDILFGGYGTSIWEV